MESLQHVKTYVTHLVKNSVRRLFFAFDIGTDIRTFLILWRDENASYWASGLLASICAPFLVYWSSPYNFRSATKTLDEFSRNKPHNVVENFAKLFYTLDSIPVFGLILSTLMLIYWWLAEVLLSIFCRKRYERARQITENMNSSFSSVKPRTIPPLMPKDTMKFYTIIELFYESVPQLLLQILIYTSGISDYFTFEDVLISTVASVFNIILNVRAIVRDAHAHGMRSRTYLLYFMSGSIDKLKKDCTPVRIFASSNTLTFCSIAAFQDLYNNEKAVNSLCNALRWTTTPIHKTLVLPIRFKKIDVAIRVARECRDAMFTNCDNFHIKFPKKIFGETRQIS